MGDTALLIIATASSWLKNVVKSYSFTFKILSPVSKFPFNPARLFSKIWVIKTPLIKTWLFVSLLKKLASLPPTILKPRGISLTRTSDIFLIESQDELFGENSVKSWLWLTFLNKKKYYENNQFLTHAFTINPNFLEDTKFSIYSWKHSEKQNSSSWSLNLRSSYSLRVKLIKMNWESYSLFKELKL